MILILTPLALEKRHLEAALPAANNFQVRIGGHGKVAMALSTQAAVSELRPTLVICAGAAGALSPDVKALDVVVAESTVEHDFKLKFIKRPLPEFVGDTASIEKLRSLNAVHFGKIASGDEDVVSADRARELHQETGALAVAWEGAGAARACALTQTPFIEIRGITDLADENAVSDFATALKLSMQSVARVISVLLE